MQTDLSQDVINLTALNTYATWRKQKGWKPLHIVDAEGCWFTDSNGKKYLDMNSQLMCSSLGHKNQAVINAIVEQAKTLPYIAPGFATTARAELTKSLLEVLPKGLDKYFFATSGTEANECAIKMARLFTGKYKIISRYRSYHGSTSGAVACTGDWRRWPVEPHGKVEGVIFAPDMYCYRCPLHHSYPGCNVACVEYIDYMIERESNVAAVIVEPIVGTNGVLVPVDEYLPRLREITKKHGVLLICDEVMSGWGRTGEWFAVNHWNVVPDILVTAKGITGAYVPLGLTATTREIADFFEDHYFPHGHTYEAHPLTLLPAVAAINEYKRLNLVQRSRDMEKVIGQKLKALVEKHPSVGEIRGKGMFWAVELVKNRKTREPFNSMQDKADARPLMVDQVCSSMLAQGVHCMAWVSHVLLCPPLIITEDELDIGLAALDRALEIPDAVTTN
ncbi:MAG: aminotransferase family protein [Candidatus Xenobia bacterium]